MEFNQNNTHIIICDEPNIKIFNVDPFVPIHTINNFPSAKIAKMHYTTNLIFIVDNGCNALNIYNDEKKDIIESITFNSKIKDVKSNKSFVTVLLDNYINLYKFEDVSKSFLKINVHNDNYILSENKIIYIEQNQNKKETIKILDITKNTTTEIVNPHENKIRTMIHNNENMIATASERGTLIRIFDINSSSKLYELRRGSSQSNILHMAFSSDLSFLAVLSDSGTIHIYNLGNVNLNRKSMFSMLGGYFDSEWSFAWYFDNDQSLLKKCMFDKNNNLIVISNKYTFTKYSFDVSIGGLCTVVKNIENKKK